MYFFWPNFVGPGSEVISIAKQQIKNDSSPMPLAIFIRTWDNDNNKNDDYDDYDYDYDDDDTKPNEKGKKRNF